MARILTTAIVADIRNKLNGSVFSKNRYGSYVRTKVTPVNPQTSFQQAARNRLASLSASWRTLEASQRQAWIDAAVNFPVTNIFGNTEILSGQALYVSLNTNLILGGQAQITDPPAPGSIPVFAATALSADAGLGELEVTVSSATVPTGFTMLVYATPSVGTGKQFVKNLYRFIGTATATAGVSDIATIWEARFGTMTPGQNQWVRVALLNNTTGQVGVPSEVSAFNS